MEEKVLKNIFTYQETLFMGMTGRQVGLAVAGVLLVVVTYFATSGEVYSQVASYIGMFCGLPCFLFAFWKPEKMELEKYLWYWIESKLLVPRKRYYKRDNELYDLLWSGMVCGRKIKLAEKKKGGKHDAEVGEENEQTGV